MNCNEIMEALWQLSPAEYAESWDNVGLLVGKQSTEVKKLMIAVDPTKEVINQAIDSGCEMLLTHHPLIFSALKRVTDEDIVGERVEMLLSNHMCYAAMHTNFDVMGMADAAADEINLIDRQVLEVTFEDEISKEGIGRIGKLNQVIKLSECAELVKERFKLSSVKVFGDKNQGIETVAISPGSGKSMVKHAVAGGADVLITGDIDHHTGLDAMAEGLCIIDAGHYGIEKLFVPYMKDYLSRKLPEVEVMVAKEQSPFWNI